LVMSHQITPSTVRPAPENTHSLFCTTQPHIVGAIVLQ
jgi:hypothetical protein